MGCGSFSEAMGASAPKALRSIEIPYPALPERAASFKSPYPKRPHTCVPDHLSTGRFRYSTKTCG